MEQPMHPDRYQGAANNRFGWLLALLCAAVFALGAVIGYHSIYRNVPVAMAASQPSAPQF
jgi:hypothetical protein